MSGDREYREANGRFAPGHYQREKGIQPPPLPATPNDPNPTVTLKGNFARDLLASYNENGAAAMRYGWADKPMEMLKLCVAVLPKEIEIGLANYVARVPANVIDLDEWQTATQDLLAKP